MDIELWTKDSDILMIDYTCTAHDQALEIGVWVIQGVRKNVRTELVSFQELHFWSHVTLGVPMIGAMHAYHYQAGTVSIRNLESYRWDCTNNMKLPIHLEDENGVKIIFVLTVQMHSLLKCLSDCCFGTKSCILILLSIRCQYFQLLKH